MPNLLNLGRAAASYYSPFVNNSSSHHNNSSHHNDNSSDSNSEHSHDSHHHINRHTRSEGNTPVHEHSKYPFNMDHLIHPLKDKKDKRMSLGGKASSKSRERNGTSPRASVESFKPAKLDMVIESPPLVMHGNTETSTGALFSGRIKIVVPESSGDIPFRRFNMRLIATITTKKPVVKDCAECITRNNQLTEWEFIQEPLTLKPGTHDYPFSYLFPGHLAATTHSSLGMIEYYLSARAVTMAGEEIIHHKPLVLRRALHPGQDKASVRIFPPTNLTGRVVMPPVIHPIGQFPVQLTLSGIIESGKEFQTRWRLRKVIWRIDERLAVLSPSCPKHSHKIGGDGKAVKHEDSRSIGGDELRSGWKTDWDTAGGETYLEFEAGIKPGCNPLCDVDSPAGLTVTHNMTIELIVAEEYCPNRNPKLVTPTGAARVLRMQFKTHVTERSGLGISWDLEQPPMYEDVPASPPSYPVKVADMIDYEGSPLPPSYRDSPSLMPLKDNFRLESPDGGASGSRSASGQRNVSFRLSSADMDTEEQEYFLRRPTPPGGSEAGTPAGDVGEGSAR